MFFRRLTKLIIFFSVLCVFSAYAVVVSSLYTVQIPVKSMSVQERTNVLPRAFKTVLIRVSGSLQMTNDPRVSDMLQHVSRYVQEFSYQKNENDTENPYLLVIDFTPNAINDALEKMNLPVWSSERPETLIWMVIKDQQGLNLIANDSTNIEAFNKIKQYAEQRALPVIFPALDFTDSWRVKKEDVWSQTTDIIVPASKRYAPDDILIIAIDATNTKDIVAHWLLISEDQQSVRWDSHGATDEIVLQAGMNRLMQILAQQFVSVSNEDEQNTIEIVVTNLQDVSDYAKVMDYLRGLTGVTSLEVLNVSPTQSSFKVNLSGSTDALQRTIRLDSVLKFDNEHSNVSEGILYYQYQLQNE